MIIELESTTATAISAEVERARASQGPATGMVLTLVIPCVDVSLADALAAAEDAAREHPSRFILIEHDPDGEPRIDATIQIGEGVPGDVLLLSVHGEQDLQTVVLPLLLPDSPVTTWWPASSPRKPADDPLGQIASRRITDAGGVADPIAALVNRAEHHAPGDTDLTWTRLTGWRGLLALALDQVQPTITGATIESTSYNAPAELLAAWLASRLDITVEHRNTEGPGINAVRLHTKDGDIAIVRPGASEIARYELPGQPTRQVALTRRPVAALIAEELRRVDADEVFEQTCVALLERVRCHQAKASAPRPQTEGPDPEE